MATKGGKSDRPGLFAKAPLGGSRRSLRASRNRSEGQKRKPKRSLLARALWFLISKILRLAWLFIRPLGLAVAFMLLATTLYTYFDLPDPENLFDGRGSGSITMLDSSGNVFALRGEQYAGGLRIEDVSLHLIHAVIAAEDKRFWTHYGIDPRGIARALYANIRAGRLVQGGSTITQQLAKNVFLTQERSLQRKVMELPMAFALEMKYTKREILEIYLNRVYLGAGTYGFETAARRYFGKSARTVTPAEAAMLAGLLRAPSRYAPTAGIERSQGRASVIVRAMEREGYLTERQTLDALTNPARLFHRASLSTGDNFADWLMEDLPPYLTRETAEDVIIATTFDPAVQTAVDETVATVVDEFFSPESRAQLAVVVMEHDGAVRAMIGGHGEGAGRFNRATQAKRQAGSAFKPVVYAAGLEEGLEPDDIVDDEPLIIDDWSPGNYTGEYLGPITVTEALARSVNTSAVRVSEWVGPDKVRKLATEMGMTTDLAPGPAVALGTSETTLLDMTSVYAAIANDGLRTAPYGLLEMRLRGDDGTPILTRGARSGRQAISSETAQNLARMLIVAVESGTGRRARITDWQVAGKTGTTQEARDAWFIGYTADYIVGVWMGNDDNTPLDNVTGSGLPAEIWRQVMTRLIEGRVPRPIVPPDENWFDQFNIFSAAGSESDDGVRRTESARNPNEDRSVIESIFLDIITSVLPE